MDSMPRVMFGASCTVLIDVRGEPQRPPLPLNDGGLLFRLKMWMSTQQISPVGAVKNGEGRYEAAFYPEDAERVTKWLKDHGARGVGDALP